MAGWIRLGQQQRDHEGLRNVCAADGYPGTEDDPLVKTTDGWRVHLSDTTDPNNGFYGLQQTEG
ncbi:hypothetical protein [Streptomyces pseudovenezuelae]|uniref:hypothetical protein n=1 Tax=Streptomyces pseudovenezuelae TaxID=67350 RepID=UPI0036F054D3